MDLPPQLLGVGETRQEPPFMPLARDAGRQAHETRSARLAEASLEGVDHHLTRHVLGCHRDLAKRPQVADHLRQRQHHFACETAQSAHAELLPDEPLEPVPVKRDDGSQQCSMARFVDISGLGPVQHLLDRLYGQVPDALTRLDQPGERPEQGDLLSGIGTVPVRLACGTDDGKRPGRARQPLLVEDLTASDS